MTFSGGLYNSNEYVKYLLVMLIWREQSDRSTST